MSIQSKLTKIKQASKHEINAQEALNEYFNQDKVKQLLLESKYLDDSALIVESDENCQITLSKRRIEAYMARLNLVRIADIKVYNRINGPNFGFINTWSTESTLTVSLEDDKVKVEYHEQIKNAEEVIESVDALLFGE